MPEKSTLRKYACPKLKLSRLLLDNLFRILVQNLSALEELNSRKHTPSPTVWFLRNCVIAQNSSCRIAQNLSFAKTEKGNFARNDFCEWLRKLLFFFTQNWCAKKEKFCVSFRKQFCEWKPYKKQTAIKSFYHSEAKFNEFEPPTRENCVLAQILKVEPTMFEP